MERTVGLGEINHGVLNSLFSSHSIYYNVSLMKVGEIVFVK